MNGDGRGSIVTCPSCGTKNRVRTAAAGVPHCGNCKGALPWLTEAGESSFGTVVEQSPLPVLADFWAPWCGPCRMVEPVVEQMSRDLAGRLKVVRINSDETPGLNQRFQILGIPTLILFEKGRVRDRVTGAADATRMRRWIEPHLVSTRAT